jgi:hypothetical protein
MQRRGVHENDLATSFVTRIRTFEAFNRLGAGIHAMAYAHFGIGCGFDELQRKSISIDVKLSQCVLYFCLPLQGPLHWASADESPVLGDVH